MSLPTRADVGLRSARGPVLLAVMTSMSLVAIDATILATAVPTIVADLGGFSSFPWLFSVYLLTQAVSVPVYAKLADTVGRKPVMLVGIAVFVLGSVLCGLAPTMPALIAFRAVQGLGAGAIGPMAMTIVGDLYSVAERARVQGYLASVWGVSSVVGPTLGGVFSQYASWQWIFYVNVPLGALAAWLLARRFHESHDRQSHRIDWLGGVLLTAGLTLVMLATLEGGNAWAWDDPRTLGSYAVGGVLLAVFVLVERLAAEPILPIWVLSRRLLAVVAAIGVGVGMILMGVTTYVPTFLESLLGVSPLTSGLTLATLTMGWPIAAAQAGRVYLRVGFRATVLIGGVVVVAGTTALALVSLSPTVVGVGLACFVIGAGLGFVAAPSLVAAQASVEWGERGVVTGANMFARNVGSALGVAVLGALVAAVMTGASAAEDPARFGAASTRVFWTVAAVAVVTVLVALLMPRGQRVAAP